MATTTEFPTYAELELDIEDELDLTVGTDSIIDQTEMIHYCNKAIDQAEQVVHTIYEDYFLTYDDLTLVDGTEEYAPPTDIYAMKIRAMIFFNGSDVYEVLRERDWKKFLNYQHDQQYSTSTDYEYKWFLRNATAGAWKQIITPTPGSGTIRRWFLRQANRITATSDVMDIPEAKNFILAYMRYRAIMKCRRGNPGGELAEAKEQLAMEKQDLVDTLGTMVPDAGNEIEMDLSHYWEHS